MWGGSEQSENNRTESENTRTESKSRERSMSKTGSEGGRRSRDRDLRTSSRERSEDPKVRKLQIFNLQHPIACESVQIAHPKGRYF